MKKILLFLFIYLSFNSTSLANTKIFNLENCYDTSSKIPFLADKNFSWNVNLVTKKITEIYKYKKNSESKIWNTSNIIWNIVSNESGIITAEVNQARTNVPKKSLLIILVQDKQVIYLNHNGYNDRYQCK